MLKYSANRWIFSIKVIGLIASAVLLFYIVSDYVLHQLPIVLLESYDVHIDLLSAASQLVLKPFIIVGAIFLLLLLWLILDVLIFTKQLNAEIKESLDERKMSDNFNHLFSSLNFYNLIKQVKDIFDLYRMFDNMKTSRIVLEVSTLRQLMSHISEGVILVRKDFVVTHINHVAEKQMGLISGEIINQSIIRKLEGTELLSAIEKAIEFDKKVLNVVLKKENVSICLYPLKDKFGDVIRVLLTINDIAKPKKTKKASSDS
mgnify:CR=1 FL=1